MKHAFISYLRILRRRWAPDHLLQLHEGDWRRDPLSHPDIKRMSERERADLQFMPNHVLAE